MRICPNCGAEIADDATVCPDCNESLPVIPNRRNVRSGSKTSRFGRSSGAGKLIALILAGLIALAAVGAGGYLLFSPKARLVSAAVKSADELADQLEEQEQLKCIGKNLRYFFRRGRISATLGLGGADSSIDAAIDFGGSLRRSSGSLSVSDGNESVNANFSVKNGKVKLQIPEFSYLVYGFSLKKNANNPIGSLISSALDIGSLQKLTNSASTMTQTPRAATRRAIISFLKNARVESMGKQGDYHVYRLTWKARSLQRQASFLSKSLGALDPSILCLVQKGHLVGLDFTYLTTAYSVKLSGTDNLWESVTGTATRGGASHEITGGIRNVGDSIFFELAAGDGDIVRAEYKDSTGEFDIQLPIHFTGRLTGDSRSVGFAGKCGDTAIQLSLEKLRGSVRPLARRYIDIRKMRASELATLVAQLAAKSGLLSGLIDTLASVIPG